MFVCAIFLPYITTTEALAVKAFVGSIASSAFQFVPDESHEIIIMFVVLLASVLAVIQFFSSKKK